MAIEFVCPSCGGALEVGDDAAGRVIRCGGCMTALRVPTPDPSPHPAPASPFESEPPSPRPSRRPTDVEPLPDDTLPTAHRVDSRPQRPPAGPSGDGSRRTRRRRRPPPSGGRGVVLVLLIIGGLGLFGLFACCGGVLLMMPKPKWHLHESQKGGFRVQFPAKAQADAEGAAGLVLEKGEKSEGAVLSVSEQYVVIYREMPGTKERAAKNETDEKEIEIALDRLLVSSGAGKPRRDETMKVGGFPAREIEFHCDAGWYTVRIIVADTRMYSLIVHGLTRPADDNVRKFIDSFEIIDEKLVKKGKERAAEGARAREPDGARRAEVDEEQKRRAEEARKRREQEAAEANGRDLRRAARTVAELALRAANEP